MPATPTHPLDLGAEPLVADLQDVVDQLICNLGVPDLQSSLRGKIGKKDAPHWGWVGFLHEFYVLGLGLASYEEKTIRTSGFTHEEPISNHKN